VKSNQFSLFPEEPARLTLRDVAEAVKAAGLDGLPNASRRADEARYQEVQVRSGLARAEGMPFRWALNPYRGCTHACEYCYARKYQRHLELGAGDDFSSVILVKTNLPHVLHRELSRAGWTREAIAIGTATDPYQPIEGHYRITRHCLEVLIAAMTPFSIVTKGPMVVRDVDLLKRATAGCRVYLSVPSVDDAAWRALEPGTAPPLQRLRAARHLVDAGVDARVLMMPLVPGITTSPPIVKRTLQAIADAGLAFAGTTVARLDDGVRGHFFAFLEREYPQLLEGYRRLYARSYASRAYTDEVGALVKRLSRACGLAPAASREDSESSNAGARASGGGAPRALKNDDRATYDRSAMSAAMRSSVGGCDENSLEIPPPKNGRMMNM
jgi:DNA repair photolyase